MVYLKVENTEYYQVLIDLKYTSDHFPLLININF